jgi:hypothetical protein
MGPSGARERREEEVKGRKSRVMKVGMLAAIRRRRRGRRKSLRGYRVDEWVV